MNMFGIDLGVHKITIAVFYEGEMTHAMTYEAPAELPRDMQLNELGHWALAQAHLHGVGSIWCEDVLLGNNHAYSLAIAETKGAVLGSLAHARIQNGTDIRTVNVQTWKKAVVGHGNASKEQVRNYIDVTYPLYAPSCDGDQDKYDATCVGLYGLQITDRASTLTLD